MPAAAAWAVPAAVSLFGTAASAVGAHKQQSAADKANAAKQAGLQSVLDYNFGANSAYRDQNMGNLQNIYSMASAPQTSSSTSNEVSDEDSTTTQDYGPEGNAARAALLQTAQGLPAEQIALMPSLLGQAEAAAGQQISANRTAAGNRAARMGVNAADMSLGLDRSVINDLNAQRAGIMQTPVAAKQASLGNIQNVLGLFKAQNTKAHRTSSSRGTQTGGPNISGMLSALGAMAPVQKEYANVAGA